MKVKQDKGYTLIEIGVGLIIIGIFIVIGSTLFNGAYNNYRLVEQRNIALSYAIQTIESYLMADLNALGIETNEQIIKSSYRTISNERLLNGYYGVPEDRIDNTTAAQNNMIIETKFRRIPAIIGAGSRIEVSDATVIKITVNVLYKVKAKDVEYSMISIDTIKVSDI